MNTKKSTNIIKAYQESYSVFKNINELKKISRFQYKYINPTPQISWPKINIKPTISDKDNKGINFKKFISKF